MRGLAPTEISGLVGSLGPTELTAERMGWLLKTGQTTAYHVADDGDYEAGLSKAYTVYTVGQYSGTVNLDVPHYAGNQISFAAAGNIVADVAAGLVTFLAGDTVVIKGSVSNDGVYTVNVGGVAGQFTTNEALVNEAAGAYVKIYKRTTHSNNAVWDRRTGRMWSRYTSNAEKVGNASDGKLVWWDTARCYTLHPAAADLQMIAATRTLRIVGGAGEVARYDVGDSIDCSGFADADNNLPGWVLQSVTVNGADLDLVLGPSNSNLLADLSDEAAGGARDIRLVCRSIFGYCAMANAVNLGGYADWRIPCGVELINLRSMGAPNALPDAAAFPGWPAGIIWSCTTQSNNVAFGKWVNFGTGDVYRNAKTGSFYAALVRG